MLRLQPSVKLGQQVLAQPLSKLRVLLRNTLIEHLSEFFRADNLCEEVLEEEMQEKLHRLLARAHTEVIILLGSEILELNHFQKVQRHIESGY